MATHSSILAWKIPWTEEPGGLQSMGSQRVGHNWVSTVNNIACNTVTHQNIKKKKYILSIRKIYAFPILTVVEHWGIAESILTWRFRFTFFPWNLPTDMGVTCH